MRKRVDQINGFLGSAGWPVTNRVSLAGDASARRYDRVHRNQAPHTAVLMDAPPQSGEEIQPFLKMAAFLTSAGFSAPIIYAENQQNGLILMEDLGDNLYSRICKSNPEMETQLYQVAIDALVSLHQLHPPKDLAPYSTAVYLREANLLTEWYLPAVTGKKTPEALQSEYSDLIQSLCCQLAGNPNVCVLRDYHAENLLWLPDRQGIARVGQLDFQDALIGHAAYDLVSLLEDARRDTSQKLQQTMIARYLDKTGMQRTKFLRDYAILGAQRNLKIIGIFSRLCQRDGKQGYVDLIPRVWNHLMHDLRHPALNELQKFVAHHIPGPTKPVLAQIKKGMS
jgi:N-acetylmuramate 1-kinase